MSDDRASASEQQARRASAAAARPRGILFVLSAPSGAGKSTLAHRLVPDLSDLEFSVSYTTREQRSGEENGKHYHFIDDVRFDEMIRDHAFLEWAAVHDRRYGTGREDTEKVLAEGRDLLLDIDVQGARQIRENGIDAVFIFILPPDFPTLQARLRERSSEVGGELGRRLSVAGQEAQEFRHYDYLVINDDLHQAFEDIRSIIRSERRRVLRCREEADKILATIPQS